MALALTTDNSKCFAGASARVAHRLGRWSTEQQECDQRGQQADGVDDLMERVCEYDDRAKCQSDQKLDDRKADVDACREPQSSRADLTVIVVMGASAVPMVIAGHALTIERSASSRAAVEAQVGERRREAAANPDSV